jgi:hypothetical protein
VRCITSSTLAVSATVVGDGAEPEEADGNFMVFGESLLAGELSLDYRSFDARWMWARWDDPGVWTGCEFGSTVASDEFAFATCTLDERVDVAE